MILKIINMREIINHNRGFVLLLFINIIVLIFDAYTTFRLGDLAYHLEANPIYPYVGFTGIILLNIALFWLAAYLYVKKNAGIRLLVTWYFVVLLTTRIIVVYMNHLVYLNPPTLEAAISISQAQKTEYVFNNQMLINIFPMLHALLTYFFYRFDHNITKK